MKASLALAAVGLVSAVALFVGSAPARASSTLIVDKDHVQCPDAQFSSIQAAVTAAAPGDTIIVCPDVYNENVVIDKPLTLLGPDVPQNPATVNTCTNLDVPDATTQAIVAGATIDFTVEAPDVTINGFVIQHASTGVSVRTTATGLQLKNNILQQLTNGVQLFGSSDGADIAQNCIRENTLVPGPTPFGTGVAVNDGSNDVISDNVVYRVFGVGIYAQLPASQPEIANNIGEANRTFIRTQELQSGSILDNQDTGSGTAASILGSGNLTIANNDFEAGGWGIRTNPINGPSFNLTVRDNLIKNESQNGIEVGGTQQSVFSGNASNFNGLDGIDVADNSSGNLITQNTFLHNGSFDCEDDSVGPGTGGTANIWTSDIGKTENRPGLCQS